MSTVSKRRTTSGIRYPRPYWRYLFLFQSWAQLQSWAITILLTLLVIAEAITRWGTSPAPLGEILLGAVFGSFVSVIMVIPAEFDVFINPEHAVTFFRRHVESMGYVQLSSERSVATYRSKLPRLLRWDEGNISVHRHENKVTISGGVMMLVTLPRCY